MFTTFLQNLTSSIYNPAFYARVLAGERMRTKSFVFLFSLVAALIACIFIYIGARSVREAVLGFPTYVAQAYPDMMVLTLTPEGVLSVAGVEEPVYIPLPAYIASTDMQDTLWGDMQQLAVIDTKTIYTRDMHRAAKSFIWFGERTVWSTDGALGQREQVYREMMEGEKESVIITKTDADKAARALVGIAGYIVPVALAFTLVFTTLCYAFGMVVFGVCIGALLMFLFRVLPQVQRKKYAHVRFISAVRAAIFAGVLPSIVMMVSWFTPVVITYGMYTLAVILIVYINIRTSHEK